MKKISAKQIWTLLETIKDPEIPAISLIEMGIIRDVSIDGKSVTVIITPTFSGCPALTVMEEEITAKVTEAGAEECHIQRQLNPPWSSDWISDEGRRKLKDFGIAPPHRHDGKIEIVLYQTVNCPHCNSTNTTVKNEFGSTLCRAIYLCNDCHEPFEQFKAL